MPEENEPREVQLQLHVPEGTRAGVWANFAQVGASPYEFTLDFARLEFGPEGPTGGVVVARVSMSPLFIGQLIEALNSNWQKYVERAMPPEVTIRDPQAGEPDQPGDDDHG